MGSIISIILWSEKKNINLIKLLLGSKDIKVNEKSYHTSGNKPIQTKTALHLENKEIDRNIEDCQGKKPIDYSKNDEIKKFLS